MPKIVSQNLQTYGNMFYFSKKRFFDSVMAGRKLIFVKKKISKVIIFNSISTQDNSMMNRILIYVVWRSLKKKWLSYGQKTIKKRHVHHWFESINVDKICYKSLVKTKMVCEVFYSLRAFHWYSWFVNIRLRSWDMTI